MANPPTKVDCHQSAANATAYEAAAKAQYEAAVLKQKAAEANPPATVEANLDRLFTTMLDFKSARDLQVAANKERAANVACLAALTPPKKG